MKKIILILTLCFGLWLQANASNVKIVEQPSIAWSNIRNGYAIMDLKISWDNSWRDDYNWDAVYVFLKCKKMTDPIWSHLYLKNMGHKIITPGYSYWLAKDPDGGADKGIGLFIYRDKKGGGTSEVALQLHWQYSSNGYTTQQMEDAVQYEAHVVEMVYIPKGPFIPGDGSSESSFQRKYRQILPEWDLINSGTSVRSKCYFDNYLNEYAADAKRDYSIQNICDRISDTRGTWYHVWHSPVQGATSITFDLGAAKTVRYIAVEGSSAPTGSSYRPSQWKLSGSRNGSTGWLDLGAFAIDDWAVGSATTYPTTKALELTRTGSYRYYKLTIENAPGWTAIQNISMTDKNLENLTDDGYVIDGRGNTIVFDQKTGLSVRGDNTLAGTLAENMPVGYEGFYAMKYEISQAQYVAFLNTLLLDQQKLRTIGARLESLDMGNYVYGAGNKQSPVCRNGIVVGNKLDVRYIFASNLNKADDFNQEGDGQNLACNFLSPADMMAYASWSGLRPMSELEYEKMCRKGWDLTNGKVTPPVQNEYAWGTAGASFPASDNFINPGTSDEKLNNATVNTGGVVSGPTRVGSFAESADSQAKSGGSFYGCMELSGNLAEIYYNSTPGKTRLYDGLYSHGNGLLTAEGDMATRLNGYWGTLTDATLLGCFITRGGSFASEAKRARVSDRVGSGYFSGLNVKDSTMTFRLGHSMTYYQATDYNLNVGDCYYPFSYIEAKNGQNTINAAVNDTVCDGVSYTIKGSDLQKSKVYTDPATLSGGVEYVWYSKTEGAGTWQLIRGKKGKDLVLDGDELQNNSPTIRILSFKRRAYTPDQYSETGVINLYILNGKSYSRDEEEILKANNQVNGVLVETKMDATFDWYSNLGGTRKHWQPTFTMATSSYLSVHRDSFPSAGEGTLTCNVTVWKRCQSTQTFPLKVEARPTSGLATNAITTNNCGSYMKDGRDGNIYGTVKIGNQCWMSEGLRFISGGTHEVTDYQYSAMDVRGTMYGVLYRWTIGGATEAICPQGWRVPSNTDFNSLGAVLPDYSGTRLKGGTFWAYGNAAQANYLDYVYTRYWKDGKSPNNIDQTEPIFNSTGFGAVAGGSRDASKNMANAGYYGFYITRNNYYAQFVYNSTSYVVTNWASSNYMPVRCILSSTSVD